MTELLKYERSGSVATITLDHGKVNALSPAMMAEINGALDDAEEHGAAVVIAGRAGMFSGGFDLGVFQQGGEAAYQMLKDGALLAARLMSFPTPVVSACSGHAIAMGAFLIMSADYRLGAAGNFKIRLNEVAIGLTLPRFGVEIARHRLTPTHFNRATILSETYSPEAAVEAGFLDRVVPAEELLAEATAAATALTELNMRAHAETKLLTREQALELLHSAIEQELGTYEDFVDKIASKLMAGR